MEELERDPRGPLGSKTRAKTPDILTQAKEMYSSGKSNAEVKELLLDLVKFGFYFEYEAHAIYHRYLYLIETEYTE